MLTMDEMYICESIVYDKHTGQILGFTDMGDVTNHLQRYIKIIYTKNYKQYNHTIMCTYFAFLI